jgi:NIMA (never in mitosis gene a)-related kinase
MHRDVVRKYPAPYPGDGDLQKKIEGFRRMSKHIPESSVWRAGYNILRALELLHHKSILHRDIKSANIFISGSVYKVGDLNVSKVQGIEARMANTQTGTPYYASPEVWRDEPYDFKSDIWSLGCVLYEMCAYRPPFQGKDLESLFRNVQKGVY